jgi:tetratricopeptide (TPR) repeat protein
VRRARVHAVLFVFAALAALALGLVQLGSDAILSAAAQPASLPAHLPLRFGTAIYGVIAGAAPAPYAESMLARAALQRGDLTQAQQYAQRLPPSITRDDLLARIAQTRGDEQSARDYFVRAGDIEAITRAVDALAPSRPAAAYALEDSLRLRLERSGTHPDAVAETYWRLGQLAWQESNRTLAMENYVQAVTLSPLSEKFLLAAGFAAYDMHEDATAQSYFARALSTDPASADGYAGAGLVALNEGDTQRARAYAARARSADPSSHALHTLENKLRVRP